MLRINPQLIKNHKSPEITEAIPRVIFATPIPLSNIEGRLVAGDNMTNTFSIGDKLEKILPTVPEIPSGIMHMLSEAVTIKTMIRAGTIAPIEPLLRIDQSRPRTMQNEMYGITTTGVRKAGRYNARGISRLALPVLFCIS